jgi:hypothetical protein
MGARVHVKRPFNAETLLAIMREAGVDTTAADVQAEAEFALAYRRGIFDGTWERPESTPFWDYWGHLPVHAGSFVIRPLWLTVPVALLVFAFWWRGMCRIASGLRPVGRSAGSAVRAAG